MSSLHPAGTEVIRSGDTVLCCIFRGDALPSATTFMTSAEAALQVGHIVHPQGHAIPRHIHRPTERHLTSTTEVLLVRRGRCEIDVYDGEQDLVATRDLHEGDIVLLLAGGHGFRMLEDTVLLEVKQGPYLGIDEKVQF